MLVTIFTIEKYANLRDRTEIVGTVQNTESIHQLTMVRIPAVNRIRRNTAAPLRLSTRKLQQCILLIAASCLLPLFFWSPLPVEELVSTPTIHDPLAIKKIHAVPLNLTDVCVVPPGHGEEGPAGLQGLYKIQKYSIENNIDVPPVRILCMVYTHSNRHDVIRNIVQTYGKTCDGFFAASNLTDPSIGAWALPHPEPESYDFMWNKVRTMWLYVYQHFIMDFDWFHIGGDDMYVIPDNIRRLASKFPKPQPPLYLGASIPHWKNPKRRFCGGGAGYTLNRKALSALVQQILRGEWGFPTKASDEDMRVGRCLEDMGVKCHDTNDDALEMRYHHLDAQFHASWKPGKRHVLNWESLQYLHNIRGNQSMLAQISNTSTTFHLAKGMVRSTARDRGIRRYHAILYQLCGASFQRQVEISANFTWEQREFLIEKWKQVPKSIE